MRSFSIIKSVLKLGNVIRRKTDGKTQGEHQGTGRRTHFSLLRGFAWLCSPERAGQFQHAHAGDVIFRQFS